MAIPFLIGAGAGLVSAALFASAATATSLAGILFYLAPLADLPRRSRLGLDSSGRSPRSPAWSSWAACLDWRQAPSSPAPLPCRWQSLCYLALLSRPAAAPQGQASVGLEWYPVGRLVGWAAVIAGALAAIMVLTLGYDADSYRELDQGPSPEQRAQGARPRRDADQREHDRRLEQRARPHPAGGLCHRLAKHRPVQSVACRRDRRSVRARARAPGRHSTPSSCRTPSFLPSPRACSPPSCRGSPGCSPPASPARCSLPMCFKVSPCCMPSAAACRFAACCSPPSISAFCFLGWVAVAIAILGLAEPMLRLRDRAATRGQPPNPD